MKKSLLCLLLAVALVLPVVPIFADDDLNLELIPKVGWLFTPEMTGKVNGDKQSFSKDSTFSIGADLFFDMENNMFLGGGLVWGNNHKINESDNKFGFMNIYVALKYKVLINGNEEAPVYLYPLVNLGVGFPSSEVDTPLGTNFKMTTGFYWGAGIGFEFCNIILEGIYGCDYSTIKFDNESGSLENNVTYTAFRINLGYKFNL